jgi:hypothetical protein
MINRTSSTYTLEFSLSAIYVSRLPIVLIVFGTCTNLIAFFVLRFTTKFQKMPSMIYLSFISISDTAALYVWNFDHFTLLNFNFEIERLNETMCRIFVFNQFASLQISAFLLTIMTIDRYFTVSRRPDSTSLAQFLDKLPFRTPISAYYWSIGIIAAVLILNSHLLFLPRYRELREVETSDDNSTKMENVFECYEYTNGFLVFPIWETVHLVVYSLIPFVLMTIFNGLLIKNTLWVYFDKSKSKLYTNRKCLRKKQMITISLVVISFLYLLTTLPASIIFVFFFDFFSKLDAMYLILVDDISFSNHAFRFFLLFLTNTSFRKVIIRGVKKYLNLIKNIF